MLSLSQQQEVEFSAMEAEQTCISDLPACSFGMKGKTEFQPLHFLGLIRVRASERLDFALN